MMLIRVDHDAVVPEFVALHMSLDDLLKEIEQRATVGAQASINNAGIRSLPLRLPSRDEQRAIVDAIESCSAVETLNLDRVQRMRSVKSALMSVLLTGELRVTPYEDAP